MQAVADWSRGQLLDLMQRHGKRFVFLVVVLVDERLVHGDEEILVGHLASFDFLFEALKFRLVAVK